MAEEMFERERRGRLWEIYSGEGKSRVEAEIVLPDYKEEARRILRVDAEPCIHQKNSYVQGKQLVCELEGAVNFCVLYQTDRRGEAGVPSSFSFRENFSQSFKIQLPEELLDTEDTAFQTEALVENLSFRLMSPRKIAVRSDVRCFLSVKHNDTFFFYGPGLPDHVHTKIREEKSCKMLSCKETELFISETISLPESEPAIGEICEMNAVLSAVNAKASNGTVSFRGKCEITLSYLSQSEESFVSFSQPLEWEGRLDAPGAVEGAWCSVFLSPQFLKATTDVSENGENKNVLFDLGYTAEIRVMQNETFSLVEDAFSSEKELSVEKKEVELDEVVKLCDFTSVLRDALPFDEKDFLRTEGIRASVDFRDSYLENGRILVEGKYHLRFFAVREDGEMQHFEETRDFKCHLELGDPAPLPDIEPCRIELRGGARGVELTPGEEGLSVRMELFGSLLVFCRRKIRLASEILCGDALPKKERGIYYFYPERGRDLWEFCKENKTDPRQLCEENGITDGLLPEAVRMIR